MCVTCPNLSHQPSAMWNAKRQLSRTSFSHPHRRTESCPRGPGFIAGGSLPRGDRQKPLRLQRSCSFRKSWMESSQRCNHIHYMKYHDNQPGWWCNNHLEKWWSSSMGRMTTHILWKKQMFETTNQIMITNYTCGFEYHGRERFWAISIYFPYIGSHAELLGVSQPHDGYI